MELGWTDDGRGKGKEDWEMVPVTKLARSGIDDELGETFRRGGTGGLSAASGASGMTGPGSPSSLKRSMSNGSGHSAATRRRQAVLPPALLELVIEQATILSADPDGGIGALSRELVTLFQRDDPAALLRPFMEASSTEFLDALAKLNAISVTTTPSFAYVAMNALIGFLKTTLRTDPLFPHHAVALSTISKLIPFVSEISLRDIRKNKAERVLLPASIHEEDGGFKLHAPWREGHIDVQTAQLLILAEILKANPRDVYVVKKMLFNLSVGIALANLSFARAWLILVATMYGFVNRNYNDRAELRHFLYNVGIALAAHATRDIMVATHSMRVYMLCSARFRRLFTSMGFATVMKPVYEVYSIGCTQDNSALRDCVEYASRSFYRIHQDGFVFQTCVVISDMEFDAGSVYDLLAALSLGNTASTGEASGIKGSNDKEEIEAMVAMVSRPEIALSEIGTAAAERQAQALKLAVSTAEAIFAKENIIRLFVTVIAANPATVRTANFLRLLAGIVPFIKDQPSRELLKEGVEALGAVINKGRTGDDAAVSALNPSDSEPDWTRSRLEYILLVESFAKSGGRLGTSATKRTLEMVLDLLGKRPTVVGPAAASIVRRLAETHLASNRPGAFLRDIAPIFKSSLGAVDFSGLLDSITQLVYRSGYSLDTETSKLVIDNYISPAVSLLASTSPASSESLGLEMRKALVDLMVASVFMQGADVMGVLENRVISPNLLVSLIIPLCLELRLPEDIGRDQLYAGFWTRMLHYIVGPRRRATDPFQASPDLSVDRHIQVENEAAVATLKIMVLKIAVLRVPEVISSIRGLWTHLSAHFVSAVRGGSASFLQGRTQNAPRMIDWMMWSLFELIVLCRTPLILHMRYEIQICLLAIVRERDEAEDELEPIRSETSVQGLGFGGDWERRISSSPQIGGLGRARASVARVRAPSLAYAGNPRGITANNVSPLSTSNDYEQPGSLKDPSRLSPLADSRHGTIGLGYPSRPSIHTNTSGLSAQSNTSADSERRDASKRFGSFPRPSFSELSARRASRPILEGRGASHLSPNPLNELSDIPSSTSPTTSRARFASTATVRNVEQGGIVHLLSAPHQVLMGVGSGGAFAGGGIGIGQGMRTSLDERKSGESGWESGGVDWRELAVGDELAKRTRRAVRAVGMMLGVDVGMERDGDGAFAEDEVDQAVRVWTVSEALVSDIISVDFRRQAVIHGG
jgi:hypothetical protein